MGGWGDFLDGVNEFTGTLVGGAASVLNNSVNTLGAVTNTAFKQPAAIAGTVGGTFTGVADSASSALSMPLIIAAVGGVLLVVLVAR